MSDDELVVLTRAEFERLERQARAGAAASQRFDAEEMQAIRDQYEERITVERERREELEWKLRVELAKIRDAELHSRRAGDDLRRIEHTFAALLAEGEDPQVRPAAPVVPPSRPAAPAALKKPVPPPLPPAPAGPPRAGNSNGNGRNGSHAETFRQAMANRKRYIA